MAASPVRERKKRATRAALRVAAVQLGLERGLDDVRVEEIAERAGVSPRTFFNYFAGKDDAALLDLFVLEDAALAALTAHGAGALWRELAGLFVAEVERQTGEGPALAATMELQRRHPRLQGRQVARYAAFEARLAEAVAARLPGDGVELRASLMSGSCITAVRVGLQQWERSGSTGSPRAHLVLAFDLLAPAFG